MHKYPRTPHLQGSRLQPGDEDISAVPFSDLAGKHLVVEEKLDGANAGISFGTDGSLLLQSRGHYLTGGPRERQFNLMKSWGAAHREVFFERLGSRYVVFGEWLYAKHTVFYDRLPHYFLEFDVFDLEQGTYLSTPVRANLLSDLPIVSVPVLGEGRFRSTDHLWSLLAPSQYKSDSWKVVLENIARDMSLPAEGIASATDPSDLAEGLYIKWEHEGRVCGRFKLVRNDFKATATGSDDSWSRHPILPNQLESGVDIWSYPDHVDTHPAVFSGKLARSSEEG